LKTPVFYTIKVSNWNTEMVKRFVLVSQGLEKWESFLILFTLGLTMLGVSSMAHSGEPSQEQVKAESIRFRPISNNDYAVFPVNWPPEHRYRAGLIRVLEDYEKIFNAAALAGNKKPYAPAKEMFKDEMLVFVCKVIPAVADIDKELRLEKIVAKGSTLEVRFAYRNSSNNSTYQIKATAAAWIPKHDYATLKFFEGNTLIKEISLDDKHWVSPELE
jgi:hypothetical protein